jgi:hypothetical protein
MDKASIAFIREAVKFLRIAKEDKDIEYNEYETIDECIDKLVLIIGGGYREM